MSEISRRRNGIVRLQCQSRYTVYTMEVGMAWGNAVSTTTSRCSIARDEIGLHPLRSEWRLLSKGRSFPLTPPFPIHTFPALHTPTCFLTPLPHGLGFSPEQCFESKLTLVLSSLLYHSPFLSLNSLHCTPHP